MGKITKRDRESLLQLVFDCATYRFTEKESLEYIQKRFGKTISGRTYRRYKQNFENGNETKKRINDFVRVGAAIELQIALSASKHLLDGSRKDFSTLSNISITLASYY